MTLAPTGELVAAARAARTGIAAFNVVTLEHAEAIVAGAERAARPVILQVSHNAVRFHGGALAPIAAASRAVAAIAAVDVALHLDHVEDTELLYQAADAGFSSAMYDASTADYAANVTATAAAARWAHERSLWLEAELGEVGGKEGARAPGIGKEGARAPGIGKEGARAPGIGKEGARAPGIGKEGARAPGIGTLGAHAVGVRTDPDEAAAYVAATGVDALAVAVGSSHAMTTRTAALDLDLIAALRDALDVPLVLHGSSGVPDGDLAAAVDAGMVKINIGTALSVAGTGAVRTALAADDTLVDPRKYLRPAREAMADTVAHLVGVITR